VSDPALVWQTPPQGHSAGSLTPQVSVLEMCCGVRVDPVKSCRRIRRKPTSKFTPRMNTNLRSLLFDSPALVAPDLLNLIDLPYNSDAGRSVRCNGGSRERHAGATISTMAIILSPSFRAHSSGVLVRVKAPFASAHRYAALTRPARSRLVCNYRSDGEISDDRFRERRPAFPRATTDHSPVG
jgi:hypothetical protein